MNTAHAKSTFAAVLLLVEAIAQVDNVTSFRLLTHAMSHILADYPDPGVVRRSQLLLHETPWPGISRRAH